MIWTDDPTRPEPVLKLATAVLLNALFDLFNSALNTASPGARDLVKSEAISFLTDQHNTWAESREFWCLAANVDPDLLRARVVAFLEGDDRLVEAVPVPKSQAGKKARKAGIQQVRDIWSDRKAHRPPERSQRPAEAKRPTRPSIPFPRVSAAKPEASKVVKLRPNATRLHSTLAAMDGWTTADDLVEILGIGKGDVNQDLHRLLGQGHVEKQGQYWRRLPPETAVAAANG